MSNHGFNSVILDVDSTLCGIEGVDWLAALRGDTMSERVATLTERAMAGAITLDQVYGERLAMVQPTWAEISALADAYASALAPDAEDAIRRLTSTGRRVVLISGGLREAIVPVAVQLGIPQRDVHAVSVQFDSDGRYAGYDTGSPLATSSGKRDVAASLKLKPRVLAMGDGVTDLAMRPAVDAFAAFVGFVRRPPVVELADLVVESFDQLLEIVLV